MKEIDTIINHLENEGLLNADTRIKIGDCFYDGKGQPVQAQNLEHVSAAYAVFSYGPYSRRYSTTGKALKASTDDAAQYFGSRVPCVQQNPKGSALVQNQGFVVEGRFIGELIGGCILIEKLCRIELLSKKLGKVHYLSPFLCQLEHFIYRKSYSKRAMQDE